PEDGKRRQIDGVIRMQVSQEDAAQVRRTEAGLHQLVSHTGPGIHQIDALTDDYGGGDPRALARVFAGPPTRSASGAQRNNVGVEIDGGHGMRPFFDSSTAINSYALAHIRKTVFIY